MDYSPEAEAKVELYTRLGFDKLPICMAKTHLSFTPDASVKGAPTGFRVMVREIRASGGSVANIDAGAARMGVPLLRPGYVAAAALEHAGGLDDDERDLGVRRGVADDLVLDAAGRGRRAAAAGAPGLAPRFLA